MQQKNKECVFSIELKTKDNLKTINLGNGSRESVLLEGTIGELQDAGFAEGIVLEVVGKKGVLRVDLSQEQIQNKLLVEVKKQ